MTSPAICIYNGWQQPDWNWSLCEWHFFTNPAKLEKTLGAPWKLNAYQHIRDFSGNEDRFSQLANWACSLLECNQVQTVLLEGYALGAKGRVFDIAECTGLLKQTLWRAGIKFQIVPPPVIKRFATGKGNAQKQQMMDAFVKDTGIAANQLKTYLTETEKQHNPSSDIVDAYFLAKYNNFNKLY